MGLIRIDHRPTRTSLHVFGVAWLVFFSVVAWIVSSRSDSATAGWMTLAVTWALALAGFAFPAFMRLLYVGLSYVAFPIGFVISHAVVVLLFYLVFTPVGVALRLAGYDPMHRKPDPEADSYWTAKPEDDRGPSRYLRQY